MDSSLILCSRSPDRIEMISMLRHFTFGYFELRRRSCKQITYLHLAEGAVFETVSYAYMSYSYVPTYV